MVLPGQAQTLLPWRAGWTGMGLVMPCERNSVEPMVAVTAPTGVGAQHQSMLHFVGEASWSDELVLAEVRDLVLPAIERHEPTQA
jgi:SRSO17 transposase